MTQSAATELAPFLNPLFERYHRKEFLSSDPLEFPHRYPDPFDQETVALVAALLAYGNVKQIRKSVADLLERMGRVSASPAEFVRLGRRKSLRGFVHRFNVGEDFELLFELLARSWEEHGSLGAHFVSHLSPEARDISDALSRLIADWRKWAGARGKGSFSYLLTSPADGSCCKRWCMFLRWMGREEKPGENALDLGLWSRDGALRKTFPEGRFLRADQLVIPLDTHTGRISHYLGLTRRRTLDWKAALEVTEALRSCDPSDPTRYDFALARLGILDLCQRRFKPEVCSRCALVPVCLFAREGQKKLDRQARRKAAVPATQVAR